MSAVTIEMMSSCFLLWRCLHSGPLTKATIDHPTPHPDVPWDELRPRNLPLLKKLTEVYGACAVVAYDGDEIVGMLRFYPKEVYEIYGAGHLCMQQVWPYGPAQDFANVNFLPPEQLSDRTLLVHCLMTGSPQQAENPYQRKGLGSQMARKLIEWARDNGWTAVEATAYEDLPLVYAITGTTGKTFWEKLGFHIAWTGVEPELTKDNDFTKTLREQALACGLSLDSVKNKYMMRLEIGK
jgi:GNAT superfamily N-acetyltransferase